MVLDTVHRITDNQSPEYAVGDFKLVFKNTYDDEESGRPKKVTLNAKHTNAPDFFYYIHVGVNLNAIEDCTCSERYCKCRL